MHLYLIAFLLQICPQFGVPVTGVGYDGGNMSVTAKRLTTLLRGGGGVPAPDAPTGLAITSASGGYVADLTPEFTWNTVIGATSYTLEYDDNSGFSSPTTVTDIATTSYTLSTQSNGVPLYGRVKAVGAGGTSAASDAANATILVYDFRDTFTTSDGSGSRTRTADGSGSWTVTDGSSHSSISGGEFQHTNQVAFNNPSLKSVETFSRVNGRTLIAKDINLATARALVGFYDSADSTAVLSAEPSGNANINENGNTATSALGTAGSTTYDLALVLRSAGGFVIRGESGTGRLAWVATAGTGSTLRATYKAIAGTALRKVSEMAVVTLAGLLAADDDIATINQASPTADQDYTATADKILHLTVTAPGTLSGAAGIRHSVQDANNYHWAGFGSSGEFRAYKVVAGVLTEYSSAINVAGVITTSAARTIVVKRDGNKLNFWTYAAGVPTKRGGEITDTSFSSATTVTPKADAGWTLGALRSYPMDHAAYTAALSGLSTFL